MVGAGVLKISATRAHLLNIRAGGWVVEGLRLQAKAWDDRC